MRRRSVLRAASDSSPAEALVLRAWALHVLAGAAPPERISGRAAACSPEGWDRFLRVERCALALGAAAVGTIPPAGREVLELRRTTELKRVLSARAQLLWLGRAALAREWPVIVLKGGAEVAAGGAPLDLADVDVLAPAGLVEPLAALLDASGYDALGTDARVGAEGGWHLGPRLASGSIQVEVHYTVRELEPVADAISRSVPVAPGLRRLAAADELWHLLVHSVSHHPQRRGNLRELLLLGRALARATPLERRAVEERAAAHRHSSAMLGVLRMGRSVAAGIPPADEFRVVAAAAYTASASAPPLGSTVLAIDRTDALFASLGGDGVMGWAQLVARAPVPSVRPELAFLERRLPTAGRTMRVLQRALRRALAYGLSRPILWRARRLSRDAERMDAG